jgi:hypothetical protein
MPTLKGLTQSDQLTLDDLTVGVVEAVIERGAKEVLGVLPFKSFEGANFAFNYEATLPTTTSVINPYQTSNLSEGVGTVTKVQVPSRGLARNADTPRIDVIGKSDINDQRAGDVLRAAKKLGEDFARGFVQGITYGTDISGGAYQLHGLDHWVDFYDDSGGFTEQDFVAAGGALSLDDIVDLLSRQKGNAFNVVFLPRPTMNAFRGILNDMPGNTAEMVMEEKFGKPVLMYDGIPFVTLDPVEADKVVGANNWAVATNAVTYDTLDNSFRGFSQSDIGKTISDASDSTTVATWVDADSITVASGASLTDTEALTLDGDSVPLIYAVFMDEEEGVSAVYHRNLGDLNASMGEHNGPIAGFTANEIGLLESAGDIFRVRLSWYGNIASQSPYAIARMRGFTNS